MSNQNVGKKFLKLVEIIRTLRGENGCPWDREQTRHSLLPYLLEEAHEALEALENNDNDAIKEELGDVLIQIIFHSQISEEQNIFTIEDVLDTVNNKLINRHPHVYQNLKLKDSNEVLTNWNKLKHKEKQTINKNASILGEYPLSLPILHKILRITDKASKVGFDWPNAKSVVEKIEEELNELKVEIDNGKNEKIENEIGDLIFSIVNLARFLEINPEIALRGTLNKFIKRFGYIEKKIKENKLNFSECDLDLLESYWREAKEHV